MKLSLLFTLVSFSCMFGFFQKKGSNVDILYAYDAVEEKPEFPGGCTAFYEYIDNNLTYPCIAKNKKISGSVCIEFTIDASGKVSNAKATSCSHPCLEYSVLKIFKSMPNWTPGKHNGTNVAVVSVIPITFVLTEDITL